MKTITFTLLCCILGCSATYTIQPLQKASEKHRIYVVQKPTYNAVFPNATSLREVVGLHGQRVWSMDVTIKRSYHPEIGKTILAYRDKTRKLVASYNYSTGKMIDLVKRPNINKIVDPNTEHWLLVIGRSMEDSGDNGKRDTGLF